MTAEQTIAIRRLMEDAVRAVATANESAQYQAQLAELEAAVAHTEMAAGGGHHGQISTQQTSAGEGPFTPVYEEPEEDEEEPTYIVTGFTNCYWQNCGKTILMSDQTIPGANGFIALRAGATPSTAGQATLQCYADLTALQTAQEDVAYFTIPLYLVEDSKITLDMRRMPNVYLAEVLT